MHSNNQSTWFINYFCSINLFLQTYVHSIIYTLVKAVWCETSWCRQYAHNCKCRVLEYRSYQALKDYSHFHIVCVAMWSFVMYCNYFEKYYFRTMYLLSQILTICDRACKNRPSEHKKIADFCRLLYHNLITVYTTAIKSLSLLQNLIDFLLQLT